MTEACLLDALVVTPVALRCHYKLRVIIIIIIIIIMCTSFNLVI